MKKALSVLLVIAMLFTLAACGGGDSSSPSGSDSKSESQSESESQSGSDSESVAAYDPNLPDGDFDLLIYLHANNPSVSETPTEENPKVYNSSRYIINSYNEMYPNLNIEVNRSLVLDNYDSVLEQMSILVNSGQCPDIFFAWGNMFANQGWLYDMTTFMYETPNQYEAGNTVWKDMYYDYSFEPGQMSVDLNGNVVSVPIEGHVPGVIGVFYNKEIFAELGAELPTTWQQMNELALAARDAGYVGIAPWGGTGIKVDNWEWWSMLAPALTVGRENLDADQDGKVSTEEGMKAWAEGWYYTQNNEYGKNIFRAFKYKVTQVFETGWDSIDYATPWVEGKVAMVQDGLWRLPDEASRTNRPFDYDIFLHPFPSTDTDFTIDGVNVKLDDPSKIRVIPMTDGGPERLDIAVALNVFKPELQDRPEGNALYCVDFLKYMTVTENLSSMIEERAGGSVGMTRTCKVPGVLQQWLGQPFQKVEIGRYAFGVTPLTAGSSPTRNALLEEYIKGMTPEDEFWVKWDAEVYRDLQQYLTDQPEVDISMYELFVPNGVSA